MAEDQKKTVELEATLVFVDESGFLMSPLVRRTWSPQAETPVLYQSTNHHRKVSAIAALCVVPTRSHLSLYFRLHPDANITGPVVGDFLRALLREIPGRMVLVWDRLKAHRGRVVTQFLDRHPEVEAYLLPAYAPELNPVEYVWSYLKINPLANYAIPDVTQLADVTRHHARSLQRKDRLLHSFLDQCPLSFLPELGHYLCMVQ